MHRSGITGRCACPRGLRHAFGVGTLQRGVPLNLVQRWLGHARMSTTAIYREVVGPEEAAFASLFWRGGTEIDRRRGSQSCPLG
jgi:site-specific recombinase XerD